MHADSLTDLDFVADFDAASGLARTDPDAFEHRRAQVIEAFFARLPPERRHRLRCLQWRIDMARARAANPTDACLRIYRMMWDSFAGEGGLVAMLQHAGGQRAAAETLPRARVLPLTGPRHPQP